MRGRYSAVPPECAADRRLGATELRVLIAIGGFADRAGKAYPSLATIAREAGLDRRKVPGAIAKLEACGWLRRSRRGRGSNDYEIVYQSEVSPPEVTPDAQNAEEVTPLEVTEGVPSTGDSATPPEVTGDTSRGDRVSPPEVTEGVPSRGALTAQLFTSPENSPEDGKRFAPDTVMPAHWRSWAICERPDLDPDRVFERFRDYWAAKPGKAGVSANWTATWRNWLRRERDTPAPSAQRSPKARGSSGASSYQAPPDPERSWPMRAKGYGQMLAKGMSLGISVTDRAVRRLVREGYATREQAERAGYYVWDDDDDEDASAKAA